MSLSGVTTISKVKFKVTAAEKEYYVDKVTVRAVPEGVSYKMADRSYVTKISGYHLEILVEADDVIQDSGTTEDFIALQAEIEDSSTSVYFYPDASQSENYEVVNINFNPRIVLETDFDTRINGDVIVCNTKDLITKTNLEWYKKF